MIDPNQQLTPEQSTYFQTQIGNIQNAINQNAAQKVTTPTTVVNPQVPTISATNLKTAPTPLNIPPAPQDQSNPSAILMGITQGLQGNLNTATNNVTDASGQYNDLYSRIQSLGTQDLSKSNDQLALEQGAGITDQQKGIQELTNQINQLNATTQAAKINTQDQPILGSIVAGQQNAIDRNSALQALTLNAALQAKQGNLSLAQNQIQHALDLKYKPIEDELAYKLQLIGLNKDQLSRADQQKATAQQQLLTSQLQQVTTQKDAANTIGQVYTDAAQGGAPNTVLSQIQQFMSNGDVQGAYQAAGQYLQKNKYQFIQSYDPSTGAPTLIRVNNVTGQIGGSTATAGAQGGNPGTSQGGITQSGTSPNIVNGSAITNPNPKVTYDQYGLLANTTFNPDNFTDKTAYNYLTSYLNNGSIPTANQVGLSGRGAATSVQFNNASQRARDLYFKATGQPLPDPQILASNKKLIENNNKLANNLTVQEATVNKNFGLNLDNLNKNNINTAVPILNDILNTFNNALGDPATAQYFLQNSTIQTEAGNLLAVKNAAGTTVFDKMTAAGLLPKNATKDQQVAIMKTLLQEAKNSADSINETNSTLYRQIDPLQINPQNPVRLNNDVGNNTQTKPTSMTLNGKTYIQQPDGTYSIQ